MTADTVGGVWQYAVDLAAALAARGHEIVVAVLGPPVTADQRHAAENIDGVRLLQTALPLDWLADGPATVLAAGRVIARLARAERADVVHCNSPAFAGSAAFAMPVVAVTHGCIATWWQAAKSEPLASEFHWHRDLTKQGLLAAEAVVSPSASYAALVQQTYGLPRLPAVVHNGRAAIPRSSRPEPSRMALTVGRQWDPVKNAELLDAVAARLPVPFLAVGPTRAPHGGEVSLSHLQALGPIESAELSHLLAQRPVFVSGATFEPFGLAVLEAAQAGCPLVLSSIPTFHELWDGCALFVDPHDVAGFTHAIERLLDGPRLAADLSEAAAERAQRFTPAAAAARMSKTYAGVLERTEVAA
jgi:glycosyltransferase involved in cell wall biosynthesis